MSHAYSEQSHLVLCWQDSRFLSCHHQTHCLSKAVYSSDTYWMVTCSFMVKDLKGFTVLQNLNRTRSYWLNVKCWYCQLFNLKSPYDCSLLSDSVIVLLLKTFPKITFLKDLQKIFCSCKSQNFLFLKIHEIALIFCFHYEWIP